LVPEFSWIFSDYDVGDSQHAYQLLVASSSEHLSKDWGGMWNSGQVFSTTYSSIPYGGLKSLEPGTTYYWKVKTWDDDTDAEGIFCPEQTFTTAAEEARVHTIHSGFIVFMVAETIAILGFLIWTIRNNKRRVDG